MKIGTITALGAIRRAIQALEEYPDDSAILIEIDGETLRLVIDPEAKLEDEVEIRSEI